jgi:hypothetical protein
LLDALRWTLVDAEEAILCSAFVKRAGVHLIEPNCGPSERKLAW